MSLVFLAEDFPPARGGIQTVCYELPLAIQQAGEEVGVVSVCRPGAGEFDVDCPYPIVRVPQGKKLQTGTNMAEGVAELIGEIERPRAIIATKWFPEGLAAISTIKLRKPKLVLMTYGLEFLLRDANPIKWVTKWLLQKYILRQMEIGITISNWTADKLARTAIGRDNIHVVNPGVRARQFQHQQKLQQLKDRLDLPEEAPTILTVGRLVARKGHADVIRALPDVIDSVGPVHYVIVGSGPQEQALKELAESSDGLPGSR